MSYLLVNAKTHSAALLIAYKMKAKLEKLSGKTVRVVQDVFPATDAANKLREDLENPFAPLGRKLPILLGLRSFILNKEILPALDNGELVLQVGGILDDNRYINESKITFTNLLQEQVAIIQKTNRVRSASPVGALYCGQIPHDNVKWNQFRYKTRKLAEVFPLFKNIPYSENIACANTVLSHML